MVLIILGLIPRFLKMISQQNAKTSSSDDPNYYNNKPNQTVIQPSKRVVYVNAIFELQDGSNLPETKLGLVKLLKTNKAIPFHKWVCPVCHTIPHYERWQHTDLLTGIFKKFLTWLKRSIWNLKLSPTYCKNHFTMNFFIEITSFWLKLDERKTMSHTSFTK